MKRWRGWVIAAVLISAYLGYQAWSQARVTPPADVRRFESLVDWRAPKRLLMFEAEGKTWLMADGPNVGLLPSGPSAYVFDQSGTMVDWAADCGDNHRFQRRWPNAMSWSPREITLEEARAWIATPLPASSETSPPATHNRSSS